MASLLDGRSTVAPDARTYSWRYSVSRPHQSCRTKYGQVDVPVPPDEAELSPRVRLASFSSSVMNLIGDYSLLMLALILRLLNLPGQRIISYC